MLFRSALDRADVIVRTGSCDFKVLSNQKEWFWSARAGSVRDWNSRGDILLEVSRPVHLVTGIARPGRVRTDLKALGYELAEFTCFADHYAYSKQDVQAILETSQPVVTTAKDAVKLLPLWPADLPLWVLEQQTEAQQGLADAIVDSRIQLPSATPVS